MDNLNDLAIFVKVVEAGGFTAAASELRMSPALVSRRLQHLEEELGVQLLNRSTRHIAPTEAGETLYAECARALGTIDAARQTAMELSAEPRGRLRLHAAVGVGRELVAEAVAAFKLKNPGVSVDLNISSDRVTPLEGGYDVIVRTADLTDSSLDCREYGPIRYLVVAAPDFLRRHGTPRTPKELSDYECLIHYGRRPPTEWPFIGPKGTYTVQVSGSFWSNNSTAIHVAAIQGLGVARVPEYVLRGHRGSAGLRVLFDDCVPNFRTVKAYYPRTHHLPAKVAAFLDCLGEIDLCGAGEKDEKGKKPRKLVGTDA